MSSSSRTSRRARQTRLTFTPLPSSSPAAAKYPTQIRDRAAAVRYDESPAKRRKISDIVVGASSQSSRDHQDIAGAGAGAENVDKMLPTPARSSQIKYVKGSHFSPAKSSAHNGKDDTSDSEPVRALQRQPPRSQHHQTDKRRATQRRLDFNNHIGRSGSPDMAYTPSINMSAPVRARTRPKSGIFSTSDPKATDLSEMSSSSDTGSIQPSSPPKTQRDVGSFRETRSRAARESRSPSPHRPVTRRSQIIRTKRPAITISTDASEKESDDVVVVNKGKRLLGEHAAAAIDIGEPETSGDDVIVSSPAKKRRRGLQHPTQPVRVRSSPQVISSDSGASSDDDLSDVSEVQHPKPDIELDSSEEEDELPHYSHRKRLPRTPNRRHKDQEQEELAEDLEFLGSSGRLRRSPTKLRSSASNPKRSQRENALELLKRRRAGEKAELPGSNPAPRERAKRALYDTESESDPDEDGPEQISEDPDELADEPVLQVHDAATQEMFLEDEYDQGFVVDDAEDTLGAPTQLPLEFSHVSRMKSKDLFKYAVEWMVQKKINPAFAIKDEVYDLAFRKLDDEVKGLAGSKFTSSAWTPEFTKSLQARPRITLSEITGAARTTLLHHCDACNRRSHPATWDIQFHGKPYHEATLEEVSDDDDSENEIGNSTTYDSRGREIPGEDTIYHVGQFCMRNARTAHALEHWRYHLNEWVVDYLKQEGYTAPEKIVERDSWSTKRRMKYANTVVDEMEAAGEIRRLHHDFRIEIDNARNAKQSRWDYVR